MAHTLMLENFSLRLFEDLCFISGITLISTKKQVLFVKVMVFKRIQQFLWYSYLIKRNNMKKLHKIVIIMRDKQAAVESFIQTLAANLDERL